jgi:hypothetical protein
MGPGEVINGERKYFGICEGAAIMPGVGRAYKNWGVADIGNALTKRRGATYDGFERQRPKL